MTKTPNGKGDLAPPLHLAPVLHLALRLGRLETTSDDSQRKGKSSWQDGRTKATGSQSQQQEQFESTY